ncbi:hypothetical protein ACWDAZ_40490, partial [Streptomyces sp. NPDC001215]
PGSPYARWFDIDWEAGGGQLLLPVLGRRLGEPGRAWSASRDLPTLPPEPFRDWWQRTHGGKEAER